MDCLVHSEKLTKAGEVKEVVGMLKNVFGDLCDEASMSSTLLAVNIQDAFSERISNMMDKPLTSSFDALQGIETVVKDLLNRSVYNFFDSNKKIIKQAYRLKNSGTVLHYSIILKDNDIHKRAQLYKFISDYKNSKISARFPIIFQSIPNELEESFCKELSISEKYEPVL